MSQWFRMYTEVLDDPKVQRLSGDEFKAWVNMLCLTAKHDGALPPISDIAFALRIDEKKAVKIIDKLVAAGLIAREGSVMKPHKWDVRQYKSDVSTDRVKRFRERSKKQQETDGETAPEAETDTETEEANASPRALEADFSLVAFSADLCRDAGVPLPDHGTAEKNRLTVEGWMQVGADLPMIRDTIVQRCANLRTSPRSLAFFDKPVREAVEQRKAASSHVDATTDSIMNRVLGRSAA